MAYADALDALGDPTRRAIFERLQQGPTPVGELAREFPVSRPAVSQHLRVLKDVGLVHVRRQGRQMLYRTNAEAIRPLHEWTETFERFWQHQLQRLKERVEASIDPGSPFDPSAKEKS